MSLPLVIFADIILAAAVISLVIGLKFSDKQQAVQISPQTAHMPEAITSDSAEPDGYYITAWQLKFMDKFSRKTIVDENSYKSPNVSIEIETVNTKIDGYSVVYHVADIYIASIDNFKTYTANGEMKAFSSQDVMEMDKKSDALISMSGDFYSAKGSGILMRNGVLYKNEKASCDICVLYRDGRIDTLREGEYTNDEILAQNPVQIWNFGPALLDSSGEPYDSYEASYNVKMRNPRSALGYYEPGHYCFVVVDGRESGYSYGMELTQLAEIFKDLGCKKAYNMDGGGSAVMCFNHERYSRQSNGANRKLSDIILICETEGAK